jgi:type IV secretion system protein VirB9
MDPRRFLTAASAAVALYGCAALPGAGRKAAIAVRPPLVAAAVPAPPPPSFASMAPIPNPPERGTTAIAPRTRGASDPPGGEYRRRASGRAAIAEANRAAREASTARGFVGGVQVFAYDPGRVYEVWTAPLRVTTLTLAPGETIVSKAAGDTVRWQIGETSSGEGASRRAHVMIKPLKPGLETNLVLSTSQRIYLIELKSGPPESFNAEVSWDLASVLPAPAVAPAAEPKPQPLVAPAGPLDAGYRIETRGRRPDWAPTAVMTDGVRTFLTFPPGLGAREAPALFAIAPDGKAQLVNYRQQGGLWVVDRVLQRAELRLGDRRRQSVRIVRASGGRS